MTARRAPRPARTAVTVLAALALTLTLAACGAGSTTTSTGGASGSVTCPPAEGAGTRTTSFPAAPPMCIDVNKRYSALMETSAGPMTLQLDPKSAPLATNNFVFLARNHYYDGVAFHRVIPQFVIQGGDATGKPAGTGDPGYSFKDELPASGDAYQPGTLAMANSGPDSNGSQFFIVLAPGRLQPKYSLFGKVTQGFDTTAQAIAATGSATGTPSAPATITSVKITES